MKSSAPDKTSVSNPFLQSSGTNVKGIGKTVNTSGLVKRKTVTDSSHLRTHSICICLQALYRIKSVSLLSWLGGSHEYPDANEELEMAWRGVQFSVKVWPLIGQHSSG